MKKLYTLFFLFTLACLCMQAQKEAYNWTFGQYAGLTWNKRNTFSSANVTRLSGSTYSASTLLPTTFKHSFVTYQGCFTMSDPETGDIVCYSDGMTIYDKTGAVMENGTGMLGSPQSVQSGILFPYPGYANKDKYILLSIGQGSRQLVYSIIDMSQGNGKVVSKNTSLTASGYTGNALMVVRHSNKKDYWIVAPGMSTTPGTYLNAWLVTKDGVAKTPKITSLPTIDNGYNNTVTNREIKMSPDGETFIWCVNADKSYSTFLLGKFDPGTGLASGVKRGCWTDEYGSYFGAFSAEFSASGKYVYISGGTRGIYACTVENLFASPNTKGTNYKTNIDEATLTITDNKGSIGQGVLQLAPDGYIYSILHNRDQLTFTTPPTAPVVHGRRHMLVITNPERPTSLNMYVLRDFLMAGTLGTWGLPTFSPSWFATDIEGPTELCINQEGMFVFRMGGAIQVRPNNIRWCFDYKGDASDVFLRQEVPNDGSTFVEYPYHYATSGTRTIKMRTYFNDNFYEEFTMDVTVYDPPIVLSTSAPAVCAGNPAVFSATASSGATLNWYETATAETPFKTGVASFTTDDVITADRTYYVEAVNPGCSSGRIAVTATLSPPPTVNASDQAICSGSTASLTAIVSSGATVSWYTVSSGGTAIATGNIFVTPVLTTETTYYVEATVSGCGSSARIPVKVSISAPPTIFASDPAAICAGNTATLTATVSDGAIAYWFLSQSGGSPVMTGTTVTTPVLNYTTTYYVEAQVPGCTSSARIPVKVTVNPCTLPVNPNIHLIQ